MNRTDVRLRLDTVRVLCNSRRNRDTLKQGLVQGAKERVVEDRREIRLDARRIDRHGFVKANSISNKCVYRKMWTFSCVFYRRYVQDAVKA